MFVFLVIASHASHSQPSHAMPAIEMEGALSRPSHLAPNVPGFGSWRITLSHRVFDAGFELGVGELALREHELSATTAIGFDFGTLHHRSHFELGPVEIAIDAAITASMLHATHSRMFPLRDASGAPRVCGTQSEISLGVDLMLSPVKLSLFASLQADPFHFGTGEFCLGEPPIWVEGKTLAASLAWALSENCTLSASIVHLRHDLSWDLDPIGYGTRAVETTTFFLLFSVGV